MKVFLGGTVNGSKWREVIIPLLKIDYFNPVVDNWDDEAYKKELIERETCDYCLYIITPKMKGIYAISEAVDDSNKRPEKIIFHFTKKDDGITFDGHQIRSLDKTGVMIENNGGTYSKTLTEVLNKLHE